MNTVTKNIVIAAGLLLPVTVFGGGNPQPETVAPRGTCRMVMPQPQTCTEVSPWVYYLPQGYQIVHFNGMKLYSYGDGTFYVPLSELRGVIHLTPP